jgi:hypothetical protein
VESILKPHLSTELNEFTYAHLWSILDHRFGGKNREDQNVSELLRKADCLLELNTKSVTKLLECFLVQKRNYLSEDPNSLSNALYYFYKEAKKKLNKVRAIDYLLWCQANKKPDNFLSLISWLEVSYDICQRAENEFFKEPPRSSVNLTTLESMDSVHSGKVTESLEALTLYKID